MVYSTKICCVDFFHATRQRKDGWCFGGCYKDGVL